MEAVPPPPPPPPCRSIEDLPVSLITEHILTRVPIRAAVRTSLLSREWRHRWKYIPNLEFNEGIPVTVIDRVLLVHSGPILSFSLSNASMTSSDTDPWLIYLSHNHHQSLSSLYIYFIGRPQPQQRPLNSSLSSPSTLYNLSPFTNSSSCCFPLLTNLVLDEVYFTNIQCLQDLISKSHKLTHLKLDSVTPSPSKLIITNPNLRHFDFIRESCNSIIFAADQALEHVSLFLNEDTAQFDLAQSFPAGAVCSGILRLSHCTIQALARRIIPESIPNCFQNLIVLDIQVNFTNTGHMMLLFSLMRSAPNLQKIKIMGNDQEEHDKDFWKKDIVGKLDNLRTVEMNFFLFTEAEINFICYVFERARMLQKFTIGHYSDVGLSNSTLEMLRNYQRASSQAEFIYTKR